MKRDMDLIRSLMLEIEGGRREFDPDGYSGEDWPRVSNHLRLIQDADFVEFFRSVGDEWSAMRIKNRGHDFLDSVRDPTVWEKTQAGAQKVGGLSLDLVTALAKGFLKKQIQDRTGIEVDL